MAYDGQPLYTFAKDENPGDVKGEGVGGQSAHGQGRIDQPLPAGLAAKRWLSQAFGSAGTKLPSRPVMSSLAISR